MIAIRMAVAKTPDAAVLALDTQAAFQHGSRRVALEMAEQHLPAFAPYLRRWYAGAAQHRFRDNTGRAHTIQSTSGFDQGDPLAALAFALSARPLTEAVQRRMREAGIAGTFIAYLDDIAIVAPVDRMHDVWKIVNEEWERFGLPLNHAKCGMWLAHGTVWAMDAGPEGAPGGAGAGTAGSPEGSAPSTGRGGGPAAVAGSSEMAVDQRGGGAGSSVPLPPIPTPQPELELLGGHLRTAGDAEDSPHTLGGVPGGDMRKATQRLCKIGDTFDALHAAGLKWHTMAALVCLYAGASSQYVLRLGAATEEQATLYDQQFRHMWSVMTGRTVSDRDWLRACLPRKLGGCGLQSAEARLAPSAWAGLVAAAQQAERAVPGGTDVLIAQGVGLPLNLTEAQHLLRSRGVKHSAIYLDLHTAARSKVKQSVLMKDVYTAMTQTLHGQMTDGQKAHMRSCGGAGAGSYLEGPPTTEHELPDELWRCATRFRMGQEWAAFDEAPNHQPVCGLVGCNGNGCGHVLDPAGEHSIHCLTGGATNKRHNAIARALGLFLKQTTDVTPEFEQRLPQLDYVKQDGTTKQAIMDVVHEHPQLGTLWVDVSVVSPQAGDAARRMQAARKDGSAAIRACQGKRRRYGVAVTPFVLEVGGRVSEDARAFVHRLLHADPLIGDHAARGAHMWTVISCTLQRYVALQLRRSAGL